MPKYKINASITGRRKLYRISIRIDIAGKNSIQIRNRLEGAIRPSGKTAFADYKLVRKGGIYRLTRKRVDKGVLEKHIQKYIDAHYKAYMKSKGYIVSDMPIVFRYQELRGSLLLTFLMTIAGGKVLELLKPYLQDLAESLKAHITELLNKRKDSSEKKETDQIMININIESLTIKGNNIVIIIK